ncbi:glycosyltransferase [Candidatus Altiarchaeota archaeon]
MKDFISIIIPAWHERSVLRDTLQALEELDYPKDGFEVIVVAGGKETITIGQDYSLKSRLKIKTLVQKEGLGKAQAVNDALSESKGDIIVLLDADTIVEAGWLTNLTEPIQKGELDAVNGNYFPIHPSWLTNYYMIEKQYIHAVAGKALMGAGSIAFKRSVLKGKGEEYIKYSGADDFILCKDLVDEGYRVGFSKNARVKTYLPFKLKDFIVNEYRWTGYLSILKRIYGRSLKLRIGHSIIVTLSLLISLLPIGVMIRIPAIMVAIIYYIQTINRFATAYKHEDSKLHLYNLPAFLLLSTIFQFLLAYQSARGMLGLGGLDSSSWNPIFKGPRPIVASDHDEMEGHSFRDMTESISIIIPAWREGSVLTNTLGSLERLDYPLDRFEVIIVAGGDDTIALSMEYALSSPLKISVLKQGPNYGKNRAILDGLRKATGDVIVLLDADTMVDPGWLRELVSPLKEGRADVVGGNYFPVNDSWIAGYYMVDKILTQTVYNKLLHGAGSIAFKRKTMEGIENHVFDPNIYTGVDYLFSTRIDELKFMIYYPENAIVRSYFPSRLDEFLSNEVRWSNAYQFINEEIIQEKGLKKYYCLIVSASLVLVFILPGILKILPGIALFVILNKFLLKYIQAYRNRPHELRLAYLPSYMIFSMAFEVIRAVTTVRYFLGYRSSKKSFKGPRPESG